MATIKKPIKKAQTGAAVKDKTSIKKHDVKNIMKRDNDMAVRKNKNEAAYHAYNRGLDVASVMQGNPSNKTVDMMLNAARKDDSLSNVALKKARAAKTNPTFKTEKTPKLNIKIKAKTGTKVAKDGKWIQKAINPAHKGFCTPESKKTCTPRRKALAHTLRKIAKKK